jgi:hypothetical protein
MKIGKTLNDLTKPAQKGGTWRTGAPGSKHGADPRFHLEDAERGRYA